MGGVLQKTIIAKHLRDGDVIRGRHGRPTEIIEAVMNLSESVTRAVEIRYRYVGEKKIRFARIGLYTQVTKEWM